MSTIDIANHNDGLTLLDLKRGLEDEIWFWAFAEAYAKGQMQSDNSRERIINGYYKQYPDMKAYVDDHVSNRTCLFAIRETRKRKQDRKQAMDAQRMAASSPRPIYAELKWMAPLKAKPIAIESNFGRPLPPPIWGIPPDQLERALDALPNEPSEPTVAAPSTAVSAVYATGLPGRPTTWPFVEAEVRRRFRPDGLSKPTAEWARDMRAWLTEKHPSVALPTETTLRNRLPDLIRQLKAS
ncbi:hypothetical protein [Methylocapsa palsarum]|uniref:Uncharacterized protein n=1 Tax=Methylocapsa palsarum TaxID=1612308 RepID=A0A1I4CM63_9HYPH|nr:hypothetical protein [Methylocapsa palsarum]SFK82372.1 hypothetical protein SAMN05444581_12521 [Methylocapsa palsarum]